MAWRSGGPSSARCCPPTAPMPPGPRLPRIAHQHRHRPALAPARPGGCRGRAHAARANGQLLLPGRRPGHRRRAGGRNLSAGRIDLRPRQPGRRLPFCGEDNRWGGRLAMVCHEKYGLQSIPGYLENGVPPKYGAGAEQIVASVHKNPLAKHTWITDLLGPGTLTASSSNGAACCGRSPTRPTSNGRAGAPCRRWPGPSSTRPSPPPSPTSRRSNSTKPAAWTTTILRRH